MFNLFICLTFSKTLFWLQTLASFSWFGEILLISQNILSCIDRHIIVQLIYQLVSCINKLYWIILWTRLFFSIFGSNLKITFCSILWKPTYGFISNLVCLFLYCLLTLTQCFYCIKQHCSNIHLSNLKLYMSINIFLKSYFH